MQSGYLKDFVESSAIKYNSPEKPLVSPSGRLNNWLIDLRPTLLNAKTIEEISRVFWDRYQHEMPFQIGGLESSAITMVTALVIHARLRGIDVNGFYIRKERKKSGMGNRIEGKLLDLPVVLVDDLFNSGSTMEKARIAIEQEGRTLSSGFVVVNFESEQGKQWVEKNNTKVNSIFTASDLNLVVSSSNSGNAPAEYEKLWRFVEPGAVSQYVNPKSTPLVIKDKIYMGTDSGKMVCLDLQTGNSIWKYDTKTIVQKGIFSSPAAHQGKIYFGAYNGVAYCLDANTGEEFWTNPCCEFIGSSPLLVPKLGLMFLGLEYGRSSRLGGNAAFDMATGEIIWERALGKLQHGSAAYYAPDNLVVFGNSDHDITAYKAETGEIVWIFPTDRSTKYPPTVSEEHGIVVATSFDKNIYVLDIRTGQQKACIPTDDICYTSALITNDRIFAGSGDKHLYVIDIATMTLVKKILFNYRIYSSPRLINSKVVFGTTSGTMFELDPHSLEYSYLYRLPDAITNAISASPCGTTLYASTIMNELYAIKKTN